MRRHLLNVAYLTDLKIKKWENIKISRWAFEGARLSPAGLFKP
jgi:hypothetical protein